MASFVRSTVAPALFGTLLCGFTFATPKVAHADVPAVRPGSASGSPAATTATAVHLIPLDSDDDSEDPADALSHALRDRVRDSRTFAVVDTPQKLGTLIVGLKCPPKPDVSCLQRIADHLKTDRFIWGTVSKAGARQVTADVHFWQRGKPESIAKEAFSDNLRDPSDDAMKRVASRIFDTLTGRPRTGFVALASSAEGATVLVDGAEAGEVRSGVAHVEMATGDHAIALRRGTTTSTAKRVTVEAGSDARMTLDFDSSASTDEPASNVPVRRILGYSTMGVGAVLLGVGIVNGVRFLGLRSDLNDFRGNIPINVTDVCASEFDSNPNAREACTKYVRPAKQARSLSYAFGAAGAVTAAVGLVLVLTDTTGNAPAGADVKTALKPKMRLQPTVSPSYSGFDLVGSF